MLSESFTLIGFREPFLKQIFALICKSQYVFHEKFKFILKFFEQKFKLGPFLFWKLLFHSRHTSCTRWAKFRKTAIWGIISHFERQGLFVVLFNTIFYNCILRSQQCWCVIFFLTSTCSTSAVFGKKKLSTKLMMCCVILQEWILRANFNPRTLPFFLKNADRHVFWYQQYKLLVTKITQKIRTTNTVYSVARFCRNHLQQIVAEGCPFLSCICLACFNTLLFYATISGEPWYIKNLQFQFLFHILCVKYTTKLLLKNSYAYSFIGICEQIQLAIGGDMSSIVIFYYDNLINVNYNPK